MIFDKLDLETVKNAAATCQRWHDIIFSTGYVKRFVFQMNIKYGNEASTQMHIKEIVAMVANSQRRYRHLYWDSGQLLMGPSNGYSNLWQAIHPKVTTHLYSLDISYVNTFDFFSLIADALPMMSALRSLTIMSNARKFRAQDPIITLRSDNLKKLLVDVSTDNELNMSQSILSCSTQLKELVVDIYEEDEYLKCHAPRRIMQTLPHLKQLKKLKFINGRFWESNFLRRGAPMHTLHQLHFVESNVESNRFKQIKQIFPNLKELIFTKCDSWHEIHDRGSETPSSTESDQDE
ncbi:uncharacterized protein LOC126575915 [Anopheles aquasalis]|uniref:uncharacterized protein LOC126575915 n=1 Tax=Anopheles aquasalis TaxID=42839 RepID=UPI00215B2691|nr:uncharacterized protein LOC126575915 [Anopheles aquasalis]